MFATGIFLHGFGQRYDLSIWLALYLFAAAGVVLVSFVLVVLFAGDQVGSKALDYPRRPVQCEAFTALFGIVGRFGPVEAERDPSGRIAMVYLRPWGVGLLKSGPTGWDRVVFVILMLSTLAFDGIIATNAWQNFNVALEPIWLPMGSLGFFFVRTLGLVLLTCSFLVVFAAVMRVVILFGRRKVDLTATVSAFALTLVPIALVYNARTTTAMSWCSHRV
jgi:hypothetical protein